MDHRRRRARELIDAAERIAELADVAELMGDDAGAARLRSDASARRDAALALLDE